MSRELTWFGVVMVAVAVWAACHLLGVPPTAARLFAAAGLAAALAGTIGWWAVTLDITDEEDSRPALGLGLTVVLTLVTIALAGTGGLTILFGST